MAKMFMIPSVFLTLDPTPTADVTGDGSVQAGITAYPMSYADWKDSGYAFDYDFDEDIDEDDFRQWWTDNNLSMDDWNKYNPTLPFNP